MIAAEIDAVGDDMTGGAPAETLIDVDGVSKKFARSLRRSLFYAVWDLGAELTGKSVRPELRKDEFWALKDVSFSLRRGESLGIIGPNGAGKSTLLKIITGIIKPTTGFVRTRGRVQALIELSSGMSPILTGRENIYIRSSLFGIPKAVIDERFDEIVRFAELEDYIDMPVQNYSSGMRVKLGFAIAINVDPDVLILDEVLAVGDQRFRAKAREAMQDLLSRDVALLFVSHNMQQVQGITESAVWVDGGKIKDYGVSQEICAKYMLSSESAISESIGHAPVLLGRSMNLVELKSVQVSRHGTSTPLPVILEGDDEDRILDITLDFTVAHQIPQDCYFILAVSSGDRYHAHVLIHSRLPGKSGMSFTRTFRVDFSPFHPGRYTLVVELFPTRGVVGMLYGASLLSIVVDADSRARQAAKEHSTVPAIGNELGSVALGVKLVSSDGEAVNAPVFAG